MPNYDVVIISDVAFSMKDSGFPVKVTGAYRIASHLRNNGYTATVIGNISYLIHARIQELHSYFHKIITPETLIVGISLTFLGTSDINLQKTGWTFKNTNNFMYFEEKFKFLIRYIKSQFPHVKIILGGSSHIGDELLEANKNNIDAWIKGYGESGIIKYIEAVKAERDNNVSDSDKVFLGNHDIQYDILGNNYNFHNQVNLFNKEHDNILNTEALPMEMSRGCRFKCNFCRSPLLGKNPRDQSYLRSRYSMAKEFEYNYENFGTTHYYMLCDTFNETTDKLLTVKKALEDAEVKINFACYARIDLIHAHPEQIDILKEIGLKGVQFGIESFHDPSAKSIGKGLGRDKTMNTLQLLREKWGNDVFMVSGFIVGLPYETKETANEWCQMLINGETELNNFQIVALEIAKFHSSMWNSEFSKNAAKYGYTLNDYSGKTLFGINRFGGWTKENGIRSWEEAKKITRHWDEEKEKSLSSLSSWGALSLRAQGWSWKDIFGYTSLSSDFRQRIRGNGFNELEKYADNLFGMK
jgi:hypothetical protein